MSKSVFRRIGVLVLALNLLVLAGCGGGSKTPSSGPAPAPAADKPAAAPDKPPATPQKVRVAGLKIANSVPIHTATKLGYFTEDKLEVETIWVAQGAVGLDALFGGSVQIATPDIVATLIAASQRKDLKILGGFSKSRPTPPDNSALLVKKDSPVKSVADLQGKVVAAGLLNSVNQIFTKALLKKHGVDPAKVTFVEIPFPNMRDALDNNQVEAIFNVEPFLTVMMETGKYRVLTYPNQEIQPGGFNIMLVTATDKWLKDNPETAKAMVRSLERGFDYLAKAPKEEQAKFVSEFLNADQALVQKMQLPIYETKLNVAGIQQTADLLLEYGLLKEKLDVKTILWETAKQ